MTDPSDRAPALEGGLYRIVWIPGTDHLRGTCQCGAELVHDDPVELMAWLYGHPTGHGPGAALPGPGAPALVPRPVGVAG